MSTTKTAYRDNPNLKRAGVKTEWTQEQIFEYAKCAADPVYFSEKYMKIVNVDRGLMPFEMWDFQKEMIQLFKDNRFVITKCPRQIGKCVHKTTEIKVKNKKTGHIETISIEDFYNRIKQVKSNKYKFEKSDI